jgi:hypothetical protein
MATLLDSIKKLPDERKFYYPELSGCMKEDEIFKNEENAYHFINIYYQYAQKESIVSDIKTKNLHTASLYFIGCLLQKVVDNFLTKRQEVFSKDDNYFTYLWFLTTLYHDISSMEEKTHKDFPCIRKNLAISIRAEKLFDEVIRYKKLNPNYIGNFLCFLDSKSKFFRTLYDANLIKHYLLYRYERMNSLDHGILGGLVLYNKLRKNYDSKKQYATVHDKNTPKERFTYSNRSFARRDFALYAKAAAEIVNHNIFKPQNREVEKIYKHYKLNMLIKNKKISLKINPLSFLLGLIDTIEPLKNVEKSIDTSKKLAKRKKIPKPLKQIPYTEILASIDIIIVNNNKIKIELLKLEKEYWKILSENIEHMATWLEVKILSTRNGYIIEF